MKVKELMKRGIPLDWVAIRIPAAVLVVLLLRLVGI